MNAKDDRLRKLLTDVRSDYTVSLRAIERDDLAADQRRMAGGGEEPLPVVLERDVRRLDIKYRLRQINEVLADLDGGENRGA